MKNDNQTTLTGDKQEKVITYANGRKVKRKLKDHEVDMGEKGIYNTKNQLNDLTGKEWTFFINSVQVTDFAKDEKEFELWKYLQKSVIETKYTTNGKDSFGHNLRKLKKTESPPFLSNLSKIFFNFSNCVKYKLCNLLDYQKIRILLVDNFQYLP